MDKWYKVTRTSLEPGKVRLTKEEQWVLGLLDGCPFCHSQKNREMLIKEPDQGSCRIFVQCPSCKIREVVC